MVDEVEAEGGAHPERGVDAPERVLVLGNSQRGAAGSGAQLRAVRKDGWTPELRRRFLETLALTCNVSEAARVVGRTLSGAYYLKRRDPAFARAWKQALSIAHEELHALMLRQALFGTKEEEIVLDGEGAVKSRKIKRGHPHMIQAVLFRMHRQEVEEALEQNSVERPDGDDAVMRLRMALEMVRERGGSG